MRRLAKLLALLGLLLAFAQPARAGVGTITDLGHNVVSSTTTTLAITTLAAINTGDLVVVWTTAEATAAAATAVVDSGGVNSYTKVTRSATSPSAILFFTWNATSLATSQTITATFGATSTGKALTAISVAGMRTASDPQDTATNTGGGATGTSTGSGSGTPCTTGTAVNLNKQPALLVGYFAGGGTDPSTFGNVTGWTAKGGTTATAFVKVYVQVVTAYTPVSWAPTWTNSTGYRVACHIFNSADATLPPAPAAMMLMGVGP